MNQRRPLCTLAAALVALAASSAVLGVLAAPFLFTSGPAATPPATPSLDSVLVNVSTDKTEYVPGEIVQITATVHNAGSRPVTMLLFDSCGDRVAVADSNGTSVWMAKLELACLEMLQEYSLAPGATSVSHFEWNQTNFAGTPVPANGSYQVVYIAVAGRIGATYEAVPIRASAWISIRPSG